MEKIFFENNEAEAIKFFQKKFSKINPSVVTTKEETITEGLKYFKASTRLYKLADKLEEKSKHNPSVTPIIKKVIDLGNKFEYVEDSYDVGDKVKAKAQYKELKTKYESLLKLLQKEEVKESLKKVGGLAITIATMSVPYIMMNKFFPSLSINAVRNATEGKPVKDQTGLYLKRAGVFTLCGIPTKAINSIFNLSTSAYDDKILKSVDRLLNTTEISDNETSLV